MKTVSFSENVSIYENRSELSEAQISLIGEAGEAIQSAHAPYSNFKVGAALALQNGTIIRGSNQENASFPEGLCAERVALYSAASRYPGISPLRLAVMTDTESEFPAAPCGGCRQSILEYQRKFHQPIEILICSHTGSIYSFASVAPLLPFSFDDQYL